MCHSRRKHTNKCVGKRHREPERERNHQTTQIKKGPHAHFGKIDGGLFSPTTPFTRDRLLQQRVGSDLAIDRIHQWERDVHQRFLFGKMLDARLCLPTVHTVLMAYKEWTTCILPVPRARRSVASPGYHLVADFVAARFSRTRLADNSWETEEEQSEESGGRANAAGRKREGAGGEWQ